MAVGEISLQPSSLEHAQPSDARLRDVVVWVCGGVVCDMVVGNVVVVVVVLLKDSPELVSCVVLGAVVLPIVVDIAVVVESPSIHIHPIVASSQHSSRVLPEQTIGVVVVDCCLRRTRLCWLIFRLPVRGCCGHLRWHLPARIANHQVWLRWTRCCRIDACDATVAAVWHRDALMTRGERGTRNAKGGSEQGGVGPFGLGDLRTEEHKLHWVPPPEHLY